MSKKLYVGNLPYSITEPDLKDLFTAHGSVESVRLITDHDGRSKGFGFVEMESPEEAETAISAMNGNEVEGRALTVNEARPQTKRPPRGGGGGGFRRGGRGGGGGRGGNW